MSVNDKDKLHVMFAAFFYTVYMCMAIVCSRKINNHSVVFCCCVHGMSRPHT